MSSSPWPSASSSVSTRTIETKLGEAREVELLNKLFHPWVLLYCDYKALLQIILLCKKGTDLLIGTGKTSSGYWPALCNSFCVHFGLYSPVVVKPDEILSIDYRQHFLKTLLPLRIKWRTGQSHQELHRVRVSCRFRPGEPVQGKVCLPLHQFIQVRRRQTEALASEADTGPQKTKKLFVGEEDPEEFKDPFLGGLMREPVLLSTSNRIVSRAVAVQCIHRGGRDPFNNKRLTASMLIPQPELAERIQQWREKQSQRDVSVDVRDLKGLIDCSAYDADCFDALQELQRLQQASRRAMADFSSNSTGFEDAVHVEEVPAGDGPEENGLGPADGHQQAATAVPDPLHWEADPVHSIAATVAASSEEPPLFSRGVKGGETARVVEVDSKAAFVSMHVPGAGVQPFHFHTVLGNACSQRQVYQQSVQEAVLSALNGCNACVLCYGQTGSGKTYTFLGPPGHVHDADLLRQLQPPSSPSASSLPHEIAQQADCGLPRLPQASGIVFHAAQELFAAKQALSRGQDILLACSLSVVEIYDERVTDLLTGREVSVRRDSGLVAGAAETPCASFEDLLPLVQLAHSRQHFAETAMNQSSSRAHTLYIWHLTQRRPLAPPSSSADGQQAYAVVDSHLHLVDLAGSERVKKSRVVGQRLREAVGINSSLLVLGKVISALEQHLSHVPYLESKLTTCLKAAFGGNSRTTIIINARSDEEFGDETLQSVRFGWRCSQISNVLKTHAMSLQATIEAIDRALSGISQQLAVLRRQNKQQLHSYQNLAASYEMMQVKRRELLASHGHATFGAAAESKPSPAPLPDHADPLP